MSSTLPVFFSDLLKYSLCDLSPYNLIITLAGTHACTHTHPVTTDSRKTPFYTHTPTPVIYSGRKTERENFRLLSNRREFWCEPASRQQKGLVWDPGCI